MTCLLKTYRPMRKVVILLAVLFGLIFMGIILGGPYYAKYYLEEHSKEMIGRQIEVEELRINLFSGHLLMTDFQMHELDSSTNFLEFDTLFMDFALHRLWRGHLKSDACHLIGLELNTWTDGEVYNFSDLIVEEEHSETDNTETDDAFIELYTFNDIQIRESQLAYEDKEIDVLHQIEGINIMLPGITFGDESTKAGLEFSVNDGGIFKTNLMYDLIENTYEWELEVEDLNISPFTPYTKDYMQIKDLKGICNGDLIISGDLDEPYTPIITGEFSMKDFAIEDTEGKELIGCESLFVDTKELNLKTENYHFHSFLMEAPFCHFTLDKDGDNLSELFILTDTETDSIAEESLESESTLLYSLDDFQINNGHLTIEDRTMRSRPFEYTMSKLNLAAKDLREGQMVTWDMSALMNGKGNLTGKLTTDPGNPGDGVYNFYLKNCMVKDFSPFIEDATAFPLTKGQMSFQTENSIVNSHITSRMVIDMYDPALNKKRKDLEPDYNVPLKLGLAILKDGQGRVNLDIPAEGHIDDPDFKVDKLIWKAIVNILIKAATSPYNFLAKSLNIDEDEIKYIRMELLQDEIGPEQAYQLDLIGQILEEKPELNAQASLTINKKKETKILREFLAKRDFYLQQKNISDSLSQQITDVDKAKISDLKIDEDVISFLESRTGLSVDSIGVNPLLISYLPNESIREEYQNILKSRLDNFRNYFIERPAVYERFTVESEFNDDETRGRPRFELGYSVAE